MKRTGSLLLGGLLLGGVACGAATAPTEPDLLDAQFDDDVADVGEPDATGRGNPVARDCVYQTCSGLSLCSVGQTCQVGDGCNQCTCAVVSSKITATTCTANVCLCPKR